MSAWAANTAYLVPAVVTPTTFAGYTWVASVAGTSGNVEPVWPAPGTDTIVDGGVTWGRGTGFRQALSAGVITIVNLFSLANPTIVASTGIVRPGSFAAVALPHFYIGAMSESVMTTQGTRTRTFDGFSGFLVDQYGTTYDSAERMDLAADALADLFTNNFHAASGTSMLKHVGTLDSEEVDSANVRFPSLEFRFAETKVTEGRV